jgi:hypothetical protein
VMDELINDFFRWCVEVLVWIGNITGMGYELANIVIFVILQPLLILIFLILWLRARKKNKIKENIQKEVN